jgi:hypothetical protein
MAARRMAAELADLGSVPPPYAVRPDTSTRSGDLIVRETLRGDDARLVGTEELGGGAPSIKRGRARIIERGFTL